MSCFCNASADKETAETSMNFGKRIKRVSISSSVLNNKKYVLKRRNGDDQFPQINKRKRPADADLDAILINNI